MARKSSITDQQTYHYYICGGYKRDRKSCTTHSVRTVELEQAVLDGINLHIQSVADLRQALEAISRRPAQKLEVSKLNRRVDALQKEVEKARELKAYSMDISRKSGSVLLEKQKRGEFIGAFAAYGYLRNPEDPHKIIVDPETAPIVREIFRRRADGEEVRAIMRWLNTENIPSPCSYRYQKGICLDKRYSDGQAKPWIPG